MRGDSQPHRPCAPAPPLNQFVPGAQMQIPIRTYGDERVRSLGVDIHDGKDVIVRLREIIHIDRTCPDRAPSRAM